VRQREETFYGILSGLIQIADSVHSRTSKLLFGDGKVLTVKQAATRKQNLKEVKKRATII